MGNSFTITCDKCGKSKQFQNDFKIKGTFGSEDTIKFGLDKFHENTYIELVCKCKNNISSDAI